MIPLEEINSFLREHGWIFAVAIAALLIVAMLIIILTNKRSKKEQISVIYDYLGGKDNVIEENLKGSRLTLKLGNQSLVDKEGLKELGILNIVEMHEKITLVLSPKLKKNITDKK